MFVLEVIRELSSCREREGYALSIALSIFCLFSVTLVQHWIQESEAVNQDVFLDWQATLERQDDVVNQLQDRTSSQSCLCSFAIGRFKIQTFAS